MKKYTIISTVFSIAATLLFLAGIVAFAKSETIAVGSALVSSGSVFLCLGIFFSNKIRNEDDSDKKK